MRVSFKQKGEEEREEQCKKNQIDSRIKSQEIITIESSSSVRRILVLFLLFVCFIFLSFPFLFFFKGGKVCVIAIEENLPYMSPLPLTFRE